MRRLLNLILPLIIILTNCKQAVKNVHLNKNKPDDYSVRIKVPDEWIEKLHRFDYSRNTQPLLTEFENIIKPDTIHNPHAQHVDEGYGRVLNPIFADLDGEPGEEMICLIGWDYSCPDLCVFKKIDGNWYLIYLEQIDTFYSAPSLSIAGNFSKNKVFYYRQVDGHGSDVYFDSYTFYKLIDNKVFKCLKLINNMHEYGDRHYLSKEIKANFEFAGDESDYLNVGINYNFFTGGVDPLIKNELNVGYKWNAKMKVYQLDIQPYQMEQDALIKEKVDFFEDTENETFFLKAFKNQIDDLSKTGTSQQKTALREYLDHLNSRND